MKETALAKQYIDILSIAKESADAQKLLNYRAPHAAKQVNEKDAWGGGRRGGGGGLKRRLRVTWILMFIGCWGFC